MPLDLTLKTTSSETFAVIDGRIANQSGTASGFHRAGDLLRYLVGLCVLEHVQNGLQD